MKEKILITFETANLAEIKGYPFNFAGDVPTNIPTQSELEDWLFENSNINIEITFDDGMWMIYAGEFTFPDCSVELVGSIECDGFKEAKENKVKAKEKGLQEALKLI